MGQAAVPCCRWRVVLFVMLLSQGLPEARGLGEELSKLGQLMGFGSSMAGDGSQAGMLEAPGSSAAEVQPSGTAAGASEPQQPASDGSSQPRGWAAPFASTSRGSRGRRSPPTNVLPTVAPTTAPTPPMPTLDRKQALYELDSKQGGLYNMAQIEGGQATSMYQGIGPNGNVEPAGASQQYGGNPNVGGVGGSQPRTGQASERIAFVGYKRITAVNTDFNLPINKFDRFGSAIANLGDINGNPDTVEVAVGAPGDDTYAEDAGAVYILGLDVCECRSAGGMRG
jgi:hypothetical protein